LLAGLADARRAGDHVLVGDPYDLEGRTISIEVAAGKSLTAAAEEYFEKHRRAQRGLVRVERRAAQLAERRQRVEELAGRWAEAPQSLAAVEQLEQAMQGEGIAVALAPPRGGGRAILRVEDVRVEGVRLFLTSDGSRGMIGKSGRDNQRLTFGLAGPEDFWFHAQGVAGAHVVVRNAERKPRPSPAALAEAARAAAWFSAAREQESVDVQWTRRKYVRKVRGAPPGTVSVKRGEIVRVRPAPPPNSEAIDPPARVP
jgi:predicted ribosome quality control (RQC) complex YloA/Tae2 family protein